MELTSIWREIELTLTLVWDWALAEVLANPIILLIWGAITYLLWRMMRRKD
jgi:hypothetical protein